MNSDVRVFKDLDELSRTIAGDIVGLINRIVPERERFSIALSGGRTPQLLYEYLATRFGDKVPWDYVHFFWGDERYVPRDHPDSNFAAAYKSLISRIPIPPHNVHPVPTEIESPVDAARAYEQTLRDFFLVSSGEEVGGTFDVVLQGTGEDGHTASLFPGDTALDERVNWVMPVLAPPGYSPRQRITLTFPVLNKARNAFFVVSGAGKRRILRSILDDPDGTKSSFPAARIQPEGRLTWYVDRDAFES